MRLFRLLRPSVVALALATAAAGLTVTPTAATPTPHQDAINAADDTGPSVQADTVTLPTGDKVLLDGANPVVIPAYHEGRSDGYVVSTMADHQYVMPNSALGARAGVIDKSLFDVTYLRAHPDALQNLRVTFEKGQAPHDVLGLRIEGHTNASAEASLSLVDPGAFRRALTDPGTLTGVSRIALAGDVDGAVVHPNYEMVTLRLDVKGVPGEIDNGFLTLLNVDDATRFAVGGRAAGGSYLKVAVPRGHYSVLSTFGSVRDGQGKNVRIVVMPEFTVDSDTTKTLDIGTATELVHVSTPRPAVSWEQEVTLTRSDARGRPTLEARWTDSAADGLHPHTQMVYVSPTSQRPAHGSFEMNIKDTLVQPATAQNDYSYNAWFTDHGTVKADQERDLRQQDLAEIESTYRNLTPDGSPAQALRSIYFAHVGDRLPAINITTGRPIATPRTELVYVTAGRRLALDQQVLGLKGPQFPTGAASMSNAQRVYLPGEHLRERWFEPLSYPRPIQSSHVTSDSALETFCSACTHDGKVDLKFTPGGDEQIDHWSTGDHRSGAQWQLYGDDIPLAKGDGLIIRTTAEVPVATQRLRLTYDVTNPAYFKFSPTSHTEWTFRNGRGRKLPRKWACLDESRKCRVLPVLTASYHLGISRDGSMTPGAHTGTVALSHVAGVDLPLRSVRLELSYDDGDTWAPATTSVVDDVAHVSFTVPESGTPALRLVAEDTKGNTLTQTVHQPFAIGATE